MRHFYLALAVTFANACGSEALDTRPAENYRVLASAPHDESLFTQGFEIKDQTFYESAGLYGKSLIRRYNFAGDILAEYKLPHTEFAEGLTHTGDTVALLTWKKRRIYYLDPESLQPQTVQSLPTEGWGAAFVDDKLWISDGSDRISIYSYPEFKFVRDIQVTGGNRTWQKLNELEYAQGFLWANIWQENTIIAIDPKTGVVIHTFDLTEIVERNTQFPNREALNGIAYDKQKSAYWVTGKLWPKRYLIEFDVDQ